MTMETRSSLFRPERLAIGTVQFGLTYGLAQQQVPEAEAGRILQRAAEAGVGWVDSAALYGESEQVVGRQWPPAASLKLATKTLKGVTAPALAQGIAASLERLRRPAVDALLIHDPADLLGRDGDALWRVLETEKAAGRVGRIGVSVYRGEEIDALMARFPLDIVQLPLNALDRRLIEGGQLARLEAGGVEIHARSIFLQGLLLAPEPEADRLFPGLGRHLGAFRRFLAEAGLSPLEGALYAALARPEISVVVLGFLGVGELDAALAAIERLARLEGDLAIEAFALSDETILNPALWGRR